MSPEPFHLWIGDLVELREHQPADAEEIHALTESNRAGLREWLPWLDACTSSEDTRRRIAFSSRQAETGVGLAASILFQSHIVGVVGFNAISEPDRFGDLGYWLGAEHRGRGIMTASVHALVSHGFDALGLNRIVIAAATGNTRSRAVAERLGFTLESVVNEAEWLYDRFVDHAVYAVSRTQWRKTRSARATTFAARFSSPLGISR